MSPGLLLGLVLIVPSLYSLIDLSGCAHLLTGSSFCVQAPLFLVSGMLGAAVGVFAGRILIHVLSRINPQWAPEVQWRVEDKTKLDAYFKQMEEPHLSEDAPDPVRNQAREITLAVLPTLHSETNLYHAYLSGADFTHAGLRGADLRRAFGFETAIFDQATYDGRTQWPENFNPQKSGAVMAENIRPSP